MTPDKQIIRAARDILDDDELKVWLAKHVAGNGRRSGSLALGITEEAFRYRLQRAETKLNRYFREAA